jgi:uncharacterized iron-regulated membrane protein
MNLRRTLLPVHRWVGMTLGLIALASALTGLGMVFRPQLDPVVYPGLFQSSTCEKMVSLDAIAGEARRHDSVSKLDFLRISDTLSLPVSARFLNKDTLYFDRCTGALVASQNRYAGVFGVMEWIHRGRWQKGSDLVMGSGALAMLALASLGIFLWWPRGSRRFVQGFTLNRNLKGPAFNIGLHKAIGGWIALPLVIIALTGLPNAFPSVLDALKSLDETSEAKPHSVIPASGPQTRIPMESAWATINRLSPTPHEAVIHVAIKADDPMEIFVIGADAPHPNARTYLYLDAFSGKVLSYTPYAKMGLGSRIYFWMLSIHSGDVGGLASQLIRFAAALGALVMGYTGIAAYLRRQSRRRKVVTESQAASTISGDSLA